MGAKRHHLGSTAYTVNGTSKTGEVRHPLHQRHPTPTSHRYTGLGRQGLNPPAHNQSQ